MKDTFKLSCIIKNLTAEVSLADFLHNCADIPKFLGCCGTCLNFENSWYCPPYDFMGPLFRSPTVLGQGRFSPGIFDHGRCTAAGKKGGKPV